MGTFIKRAKLAKTLDLPYSSLRIHKTFVGGTFGGKIDLFSNEYCAARLSMLTGRPVRIVASREEIFSAYKRPGPKSLAFSASLSRPRHPFEKIAAPSTLCRWLPIGEEVR